MAQALKRTTTAKHPPPPKLANHRVLVVEDDYVIACELVAQLRDAGAEVLGPVSNPVDGWRLVVEHAPDCVLLDINLHGHRAFDFARQLRSHGVGQIFTTGYDADIVPDDLLDIACVSKPVQVGRLVEWIRSLPHRNLKS